MIRKILELNSLSNDSMQSYLGLLDQRYRGSLSQDEGIRAELLAILAHLCGQGGARDSACALFGPLFMDAMVVENDPALRLVAVQGLSYVDKVRALELFKQNNLMQDQSLAVQQVVIDVAGQTGNTTDLEWLLALLNGNGHSDRVWLAIKSICQRQEVGFLLDWFPELEDVGATKAEYLREILDIAEQKAAGEKGQDMLKRVREQRVLWLAQGKAWEEAAAYLSGINYSLSENLYSDRTDFEAFKIYLYSGAAEKAAEYIKIRLGVSDIKQDSPLAAAINDYFSEKEIENASKMLFFENISSVRKDGLPNWSVFLDNLDRQLNSPVDSSVSQEPTVSEGGVGE
ncbi:MAG: HEAT repeat domain-containing protein [Planctomycetes bacterium]|nr:HEAT repeat domain-containing protein [Planctomycetota bacterium]